jgi:sarcosine oxidase/L-pipecolate oxidase
MKIAFHDKGYQHPIPSSSTTTPLSFPSFASGEKANKTEHDALNFSLMSADAEPHVPADKLTQMLEELATIFPHLTKTPVVYTRMCFYSESHNEDWIIDLFPGLQGLVVVSGDSGHGFKFLPIMGQLVCARLGLPSVPPLTTYQQKVFSFDYHYHHLDARRSDSGRHRGKL